MSFTTFNLTATLPANNYQSNRYFVFFSGSMAVKTSWMMRLKTRGINGFKPCQKFPISEIFCSTIMTFGTDCYNIIQHFKSIGKVATQNLRMYV